MLDKDLKKIEFRDYFHQGKFDEEHYKDLEKSDQKDNRLRVFYIHGGLHLYSKGKEIQKIKNNSSNEEGEENILKQCEDLWKQPGISPLCMVEGTLTDKLKSINESKYLSFAYKRLEQHTDKLVVLGNPLNLEKNQDKNSPFNQHLLNAIVESKPTTVAISITADDVSGNEYKEQQIKYWEDVMKRDDIKFFDENTHPLFHSNIRIE